MRVCTKVTTVIDLLVKYETTENGKTSVKRYRFGDSQSADTHRNDHWRQRAESDDCDSCQERATKSQVLVIPDQI